MLKINEAAKKRLETDYPGIIEQIRRFDDASLPSCQLCASADTADVQCGGITGRTISIAAVTVKFHLMANGPRAGRHFCNDCRSYF